MSVSSRNYHLIVNCNYILNFLLFGSIIYLFIYFCAQLSRLLQLNCTFFRPVAAHNPSPLPSKTSDEIQWLNVSYSGGIGFDSWHKEQLIWLRTSWYPSFTPGNFLWWSGTLREVTIASFRIFSNPLTCLSTRCYRLQTIDEAEKAYLSTLPNTLIRYWLRCPRRQNACDSHR
jgi:hypothetical protein